MGRNLSFSGVTRLRVLDLSKLEDLAEVFSVVVLGELIYTNNVELSAKRLDVAAWLELVTCPIVVSHVHEAWLCHLEIAREALSLHEESEVVATVIGMVNFSDFNGVIGEEVVNDEG